MMSYYEIVNYNSRYEQLLRGEIGGEDIKLVFVDESSTPGDKQYDDDGENQSSSNKKTNEKKREIMAHKSFFHACDLIKAAFEKLRFVESGRREIRIVVPRGTFDAIDGLMRWCYECRVQPEVVTLKTKYIVLEQHVKGMPALWVLADFVHCKELCDAILDSMEAGRLGTGKSFAVFVDEAIALDTGSDVLLKAAVQGLPLSEDRGEELEKWLDWGSAEFLNALAKCYYRLSGDKSFEQTREMASAVLGLYLAEMRRADRAELMPSLFARCLTKFRLGTITEADYATMVIDYIEDRDRTRSGSHTVSESCMMALLGTVDFRRIRPNTLRFSIIPRIESFSPSYALVVNDFTEDACQVIARCSYSGKILADEVGDTEEWGILSCGNVICRESVDYLMPFKQGNDEAGHTTERRCPFHCTRRAIVCNHFLRRSMSTCEFEFKEVCVDPNTETYSQAIFQDWDEKQLGFEQYVARKETKIAVLNHWLRCSGDSEDANILSGRPKKRCRSENPNILSSQNDSFVRIQNMCLGIEHDSTFFYAIDKLSDEDVADAVLDIAKMGGRQPCEIELYLSKPGGGLGERLDTEMTWNDLGFELKGDDRELLIARLHSHA